MRSERSTPDPSPLASLADTLLVARFHFARSVRTRSALNLCALFTLCATGSALGFRQILQAMEDMASKTLGVPRTDTPGAMLDTLRRQGDLASMLEAMLGNIELVEWALSTPYMTVTWAWSGLGLIPFLAAAVGAEAVSPDLAARTIRFEALRTGRLEIVGGRFLGLATLVFIAIALSICAPLSVALLWMAEQPAVPQFVTLVAFVPRLWVWSLPFLALGLSCSCLTNNVNWARLFAAVVVVLTWVGWRLADHYGDGQLWSEAVILLLPQGWIPDLWGPGLGWISTGVVLGAIGLTYAIPGHLLLARRDL